MYNVRVNGEKYGAGMYPPKFKQGDFISFTSTINGQFKNMETRTVTVKVPPPSHPAPASAGSVGIKDKYDERQMMICHQAARKDALNMVEILREVGGIVGLEKAKTPADKMSLIESLVNEYTRDYYFQTTGEELDIPEATIEEGNPDVQASSKASWE
jgi:hypothetical protein